MSFFFARPETFEQIEVSKDLFGKAAAYLKGSTEYSLITIRNSDGF